MCDKFVIFKVNITVDVYSDAGPGAGCGLEQAVEAGSCSDGAEGLPGGDAGSGGQGAAS